MMLIQSTNEIDIIVWCTWPILISYILQVNLYFRVVHFVAEFEVTWKFMNRSIISHYLSLLITLISVYLLKFIIFNVVKGYRLISFNFIFISASLQYEVNASYLLTGKLLYILQSICFRHCTFLLLGCVLHQCLF